MNSFESIVIKENGEHVFTIEISREERMNAYNALLLDELVRALEFLDSSSRARVAVLTGKGDAFCAGLDLQEPILTPDMDYQAYEEGLGRFQEIVRKIRSISIPVIAGINGYALGAGCDTALSCDFRIVSDNATMGETFIDVGLVSGDGGAFLLPRLIGEERAKELLFTGKKLSGEEIVDWGLARECVPGNELIQACLSFASELAEQPPIQMGESKGLINSAQSQSLDEALESATRAQRISSQTKDHQEAVQAFRENREPKFEGR